MRFDMLGKILRVKFDHNDSICPLNYAIELTELAVASDLHSAMNLHNFGGALLRRFERTGSLIYLDGGTKLCERVDSGQCLRSADFEYPELLAIEALREKRNNG